MATIKNIQSGALTKLLPTHVFGRQEESCNTLLHNTDASRLHATVSWDGEQWQLRDTSTNGTYINGIRISANTYTNLKVNDQIQFGNNETEIWAMLDVNYPVSTLMPLNSHSENIELRKIFALPSDENPQITLLESLNGSWLCESEAGIAVLKSGDLVGIEGSYWRFIEAKPSTKTEKNDSCHSPIGGPVTLYFNVSQNEEHVSLKISIGAQLIDLGERTHHYLLLTLARKRLDDQKIKIATSEQGWLSKDVLCQMLGMSTNHINILNFRLRKQLVEQVPESFSLLQIIETRVGEMRVDCEHLNIVGGTPR